MSANSIWRAATPSLGYRVLGRVARSGNRARWLPALPITAAAAARSRRHASTSSKPDSTARSIPEVGGSSPKWTGHGVLGVALAAGLLGWGLSAMIPGPNGKGMMLLDSKAQFPRYASLKEMEIVSVVFFPDLALDINAAGSLSTSMSAKLTTEPRPSRRSAMRSAPI